VIHELPDFFQDGRITWRNIPMAWVPSEAYTLTSRSMLKGGHSLAILGKLPLAFGEAPFSHWGLTAQYSEGEIPSMFLPSSPKFNISMSDRLPSLI
jgi:hypothetical protein